MKLVGPRPKTFCSDFVAKLNFSELLNILINVAEPKLFIFSVAEPPLFWLSVGWFANN